MKMSMTSPQLNEKALEMKLYAMEPGMIRNESEGGVVTISRREGEQMRVLVLEPRTKTAQLAHANIAELKGKNPDMIAEFRALADKPGEPLDDRQVGDVKAKGFRVKSDGQTISLWVHPKTARPILVEIDAEAMGETGKFVLSDITFDEKLDEKLFSLDVPEGFKLNESRVKVSLDLEQNVINVLGAYAKLTGGTFPEKLDDWAAYGKAMAKGGQAEPDPGMIQALSGAGAITALLTDKKVGEDYAYTGKDAKLGDKDNVVFWHRDKAKGTYRAVFADLTAKEVSADRVTKTR